MTNQQFSIPCDVLFAGATVSNLLSAVSLYERFENVDIKILERSVETISAVDCCTVISDASMEMLMELNPRLHNRLRRKKEQMTLDGYLNGIPSKDVTALMMTELPRDIIHRTLPIETVGEKADRIVIETKDGTVYTAKLFVTDAERYDGYTSTVVPTGFVDATFKVFGRPVTDQQCWIGNEMYLRLEQTNRSEESTTTLSCIVRSDAANSIILEDEIRKILDDVDALSHCEIGSMSFDSLLSPSAPSSRRRMTVSGGWSAYVPHASPLKFEIELEQAMLLKTSLEEKGLTAAAVADWKRRSTVTRRSQMIMNAQTPMELLTKTNDDHSRCGDRTFRMRSTLHMTDLGKPLISGTIKPYMALSIVE